VVEGHDVDQRGEFGERARVFRLADQQVVTRRRGGIVRRGGEDERFDIDGQRRFSHHECELSSAHDADSTQSWLVDVRHEQNATGPSRETGSDSRPLRRQ